MAWTATISLDPDKPDVGIATGIWNVGLPDQFIYSRRAKMNVTDKAAFVAEAHAALTASQTKTTNEATFVTALATALNT